MNRRQFLVSGSVLALPLTSGCVKSSTSTSDTPNTSTPKSTPSPTGTSVHSSYDTTTVTVRTSTGKTLGSLTAAIADTDKLRYEGLSNTASLPTDRGMLFIYGEPQAHRFTMYNMDFGLDIIFAEKEGKITQIHHAQKPGPSDDGEDEPYTGWGQYVLEVNLNWTTERGITETDILDFDL